MGSEFKMGLKNNHSWIKGISVIDLAWVWIELKLGFSCICVQLSGSCALFTRPTSTFFNKIFIKIGSYDTIHIFKNYFVTVFSVFNNKQYQNIHVSDDICELLLNCTTQSFSFEQCTSQKHNNKHCEPIKKNPSKTRMKRKKKVKKKVRMS